MIKNLLFDLGGVIMDIKRERCVDALTRIGVENANEMLGLYVQSGDFMNLENGSITADEFRDSIRASIKNGNSVSNDEIDQALIAVEHQPDNVLQRDCPPVCERGENNRRLFRWASGIIPRPQQQARAQNI